MSPTRRDPAGGRPPAQPVVQQAPGTSLEKLDLRVYNISLTLRAPAEEAPRIRRAAELVNRLLADMAAGAGTAAADTTRLALRAALLMATDLLRLQDESMGDEPNAVVRRVDDAIAAIDDAIASIDDYPAEAAYRRAHR